MKSQEQSTGSTGTAERTECKQTPGAFRPVVDRNACEGKGDCVHGWQQALLINPDACQACGLCVEACPEEALALVRVSG